MKTYLTEQGGRHHISTLTIDTPKGRRRIRRILGLPDGNNRLFMPRMLRQSDATRARMRAHDAETREAKLYERLNSVESTALVKMPGGKYLIDRSKL